MNKIIIFVGPSGVGKTAITNIICSSFNNYLANISCTTREKRKNEKNNVDYYFLTKQQFENKILKNEFLEYSKYNGYYYGILKKEIEEKLQKGNVILIVDPFSASDIKKIDFFQNNDTIIFFLDAPIRLLKQRLIERGDSKEEIKMRLELIKEERQCSSCCDYVIKVLDLINSSKQIVELVEKNKFYFEVYNAQEKVNC